jgi:hypothetical protein
MTTLRPGQLTPNDLEAAVLRCLAELDPTLLPFLGCLHVLSREYTGVGGYTRFQSEETGNRIADQQLGLDGLISLPDVPNGMGAVLFTEGGLPTLLEMFTYGDDHWDGLFDGFSIEMNSR